MRLIHSLLILLTAFLSPNYGAAPSPPAKVVTQIEVRVLVDGELSVMTYQDSLQMENILTYLRMTQPRPSKQYEPDSFRSDIYTFTVYFSDGSQNRYRQIHREFLQKNDGYWQRIDPKAHLLFPAL